MITVPPSGPIAPLDPVRPSQPAAGGGVFGVAMQAAQQTTVSTPSTAISATNPMLLHEIVVSDRQRRDRDARRRGMELLKGLGDLQLALLSHSDEASILDHMSDLLSTIPEAADPELACIVRSVAVRATVELCLRRR